MVNGSRTEREVAPETKEVEPENKRRKIEIPEAVSVEPQVSEPQISTSLQHSISNQPEPAEPKNLRAPEPVKQANNPKLTEPSAAKDLGEDFSDDSDFEMPEIDVDSDDE